LISLPFTRDQFLDVFAAYNANLWPAVVLLWLATLWALVTLRSHPPTAQRFVTVLLIVQWTWAALAYHAAFFSKINPAAWLFSGMFLIEGGLLLSRGIVRKRLRFSSGRSFRHATSWLFAGYALAYPALALAEGNNLPRAPTFGVPCPVTILTIGLLLTAEEPLPIAIAFIPIVWAFIGGSAAFLLGVRADLMLLVAGSVLMIHLVRARIRHPRL
jgi:hypothetical protein